MLLERVVIPKKEGAKVRCKYCSHEWTYTGHKEWYCSCPACHSSVKLKAKSRIKKSKEEKLVIGSNKVPASASPSPTY